MVTKLIVVDAIPGDKLVELPNQQRPAGYFQRFGVTAANEVRLLGEIKRYIHEDLGSTLIEFEDQGEPHFENLESDIKDLAGDPARPGIWYVSGHSFYTVDDEPPKSMGGPS